MKQIKLVMSKKTGLNAEIIRVDSEGSTSSHEGGADGILVDLHLRAKPSEQGRLLEMVAASRITLTFEDEEEKNTIPEETRQWMEEVVITPFKHPMAYHGSLGAGLYSEHYLATTPLDVLKERYAKYRRDYLSEDPQPTDDEPVLPEMQWRSLRPLTEDPDQMLKLYELVANKGITSRDLKLILSTLALNPENAEINSPLIATLQNVSTDELIAELETRPEITRLNCDLYQQHEIHEKFTDDRNSRIISDCVLVRSAKQADTLGTNP